MTDSNQSTPPPPVNPALRQVRHDLRGRINAMQLCVSALPVAADQKEAVEFIDDVIKLTDKVTELMDQLEKLLDQNTPAA
jgi:hypothetical protein